MGENKNIGPAEIFDPGIMPHRYVDVSKLPVFAQRTLGSPKPDTTTAEATDGVKLPESATGDTPKALGHSLGHAITSFD